MRAVVLAVLVVLACTLSVSASSADWSAPEALWSSDLSASELEARHSEFLMATDATGPANFSSSSSSSSSSSTGGNAITTEPVKVELAIDTSNCPNATNPKCAFTEEGKALLDDIVQVSFGFPSLENEKFVSSFTSKNGTVISSSTGAAAVAAFISSSTAAGRRLLQASGVQATFDFQPGVDGGIHARKIYSAFTKSIDPSCDTVCQQNIKTTYSLPGPLISESPVFATMQQAVVPGTLQVDSDAVQKGNDDAVTASSGDRLVESQGGPRNTNIGYYVLGAVLLAFIVAALIYFIVHKKPVATLVKEEPLRRDEVALAPVVAAPAAHSGVVVAEEQPLAANQQQMDYRSVFALKHNVLDKSAEQKAAEEDEHNHNDVHFILHQ